MLSNLMIDRVALHVGELNEEERAAEKTVAYLELVSKLRPTVAGILKNTLTVALSFENGDAERIKGFVSDLMARLPFNNIRWCLDCRTMPFTNSLWEFVCSSGIGLEIRVDAADPRLPEFLAGSDCALQTPVTLQGVVPGKPFDVKRLLEFAREKGATALFDWEPLLQKQDCQEDDIRQWKEFLRAACTTLLRSMLAGTAGSSPEGRLLADPLEFLSRGTTDCLAAYDWREFSHTMFLMEGTCSHAPLAAWPAALLPEDFCVRQVREHQARKLSDYFAARRPNAFEDALTEALASMLQDLYRSATVPIDL